ncbi:uncharacterized protein LOC144446948 [Glandiceps talaboti]
MAAVLEWFKNLSTSKKVVVLGAGIVTAAGVIRYFRKMEEGSSEDEYDGGFEVIHTGEEALEKRVLVVGLDGAGKTSILSCLANQENKEETKPTEGFHVIVLQTQGVAVNVWEVGGKENVRSYWENFTKDTEVLLYVVDSTDAERFPLARDELKRLLQDEKLIGVPLVVVANKQDLLGAKNAGEIREELDLQAIAPDREIHIVETQVPLRSTQLGISTLEDLLAKLGKST